MGVMSFLGGLFIIICFVKFVGSSSISLQLSSPTHSTSCLCFLSDLRSFAFQLVLLVAFSDVGNSIGNMLGDGGGPSENAGSASYKCQFQAFVLLVSFLSFSC
jgi:hypothetical protein